MLAVIIEAAHRAPSSMNVQEISVVVVRDQERKAQISELVGGQARIAQAPVFLTLVVDFNKTEMDARKAGQTQVIQESLEGMMVAARSLELGAVLIGSVRRNPQGMIDLLGLPPLTFALVGLVIGQSTKMRHKNRVWRSALSATTSVTMPQLCVSH